LRGGRGIQATNIQIKDDPARIKFGEEGKRK